MSSGRPGGPCECALRWDECERLLDDLRMLDEDVLKSMLATYWNTKHINQLHVLLGLKVPQCSFGDLRRYIVANDTCSCISFLINMPEYVEDSMRIACEEGRPEVLKTVAAAFSSSVTVPVLCAAVRGGSLDCVQFSFSLYHQQHPFNPIHPTLMRVVPLERELLYMAAGHPSPVLKWLLRIVSVSPEYRAILIQRCLDSKNYVGWKDLKVY